MRTLKNILEASVLGDIETALSNTDNAYEVMYPVPKIKDFFSEFKFQNVVWQCPELVKKYKHLFKQDAEFPEAWDIDEATGIILRIRVPSERKCAKTISIGFVNERNWVCARLSGIGGWVDNLATGKKACIMFINELVKNPDKIMKKLAEYYNDNNEQFKKSGKHKQIPITDLLKN